MIATVTYPYRDRETYEIHRTGDEGELTRISEKYFGKDITAVPTEE